MNAQNNLKKDKQSSGAAQKRDKGSAFAKITKQSTTVYGFANTKTTAKAADYLFLGILSILSILGILGILECGRHTEKLGKLVLGLKSAPLPGLKFMDLVSIQ